MPKVEKKRASRAASLPPTSEPESGGDGVQASVDTQLRGFSSGSDSSDEDSEDDSEVDGGAIDITRLPIAARDDLSVKRKLARAQKQHVCILRFCACFAYELILFAGY